MTVVLKAPGSDHRIGLYEVNIRLALPTGQVGCWAKHGMR